MHCGESNSLEIDNPERPECNNLLSIYQLASGKTKEVSNELYFLFIYSCLRHQHLSGFGTFLVQPSVFDAFNVKILLYGFTFVPAKCVLLVF